MAEKITVPTLGESVTEATVSKWLKTQGEKVSADEPLVELETDKVNVEVPSPTNGVLGSIAVKEGETVIIPVMAKHRIMNNTDSNLVFIEVQTGTYFGEDDIVRLTDDYKRS